MSDIQLTKQGLNSKEIEIFRLLIKGASSKEMAAILGRKEKSVKYQKGCIFKKLKVKNSLQVMQWYIRQRELPGLK
jgi:DNA-binding CsgD family transcriptional regulator